ncbi:MAG: hypothetical protein ACK4NX_02110 [Candidatus Paceibacteria bacterium]
MALNKIAFWLNILLLFLLLELYLIFRNLPVTIFLSVIFLVMQFASRLYDTKEKIFFGFFVPLWLLTLSWSQPIFGQFIILTGLLSYILLTYQSKPLWRESVELFFLFVIFLNFYVFGGTLPLSYGLVFLGAGLFLFFGIWNHLKGVLSGHASIKFLAIILTVLVMEWLLSFQFLPQGYFSLSVSTLILYFVSTKTLQYILGGSATPSKLIYQALIGLFLILIVLVSSGIRPR